ncbi:MAG: hypothetical protein MUQ75_07180 [Crocinitomicaceae bacterium]|nr:hypothetical protein [Crocinitomicaceae bacterium]
MYKQTLYTIHRKHLLDKKIKHTNKHNNFKYGYNEDLDCVIISKDGTLGDIYDIQGLKVGLPQTPEKINGKDLKQSEQFFKIPNKPESLNKIKTIYDFQNYSEDIKEKYYSYIDDEFNHRDAGYWFMCNGSPNYITGSHYTYLTWTKIDVGSPDFRQANRIFYYFWEACKADKRSYGMCYLKNRRSGFSFMASSETVNLATISKDSRFGILSKTGADAKKMFTDKVVPISINYPFFFKPIQDGMERPKTELSYKIPSKRLTRNSLKETGKEEEKMGEGLDTTIDWKNTGDNSYDGEKLQLLVHDESGKWERPDNILNNWRITKTCLRLGAKIVGKCMMGSTSNSLAKGGDNFKKLFYNSDVTNRNRNGQTASGLYSLFIPMEWGYEGFIDKYGYPVFDTPSEPIEGIDGEKIFTGVIEHWENEVDGLKHDSDALNEYYRQFPRSEKHAFRDETVNSLFNLTKIYEQIDFNEEMTMAGHVVQGTFSWKNGIKDTEVIWVPTKNGRFKVAWIPPVSMQNNFILKGGLKYPGNDGLGAFGCDSYDISGTVSGSGSNGALHGLTTFSMVSDVPNSKFFLEYVARPQTAEIFFEEVLMALVFYGMPILCENNKPRLLYHLKRRGYRGYSMNRPDKLKGNLSKTELELGGIPNSSEDIKQAHAAAIESYIEEYVGSKDENHGNMFFQRTLEDWAKFDISKRTAYDASISSGLAIMACRKHLYRPSAERTVKKLDFTFSKYKNEGSRSELIK